MVAILQSLRESSGSRGWPVVRSTEAGGPVVPVVAPAGTASGPGDRAAPVGRVGALSGVDSAA